MIRIDRLTDAQRDAWRELAAHAAEPNPFFEPQLLEPAWRNLRPRGLTLLVAEDSAGWSACLPVQHVRWPAYAMVGWNHPYAFLSTPLLRHDDPGRAAEQLVAPFRGRRAALLSLRLVGTGRAGTALLDAARDSGLVCAWARETDRAAARRHDGDSQVQLSGRRRAKLRRRGRQLSELLDTDLEVHERAGDVEELERFLALEASGWKGQHGTALASDAAHRAFFLEMAAGFAAEGRLRLSTLAGGDTTLAMSCNLQSGDTLFGFKSAFDERYRRYAPGVQLMFEITRAFHETERLQLLDSCSEPGNSLANEVLGERLALTSFVLASDGAAANLTRLVLQTGMVTRDRLRRARTAAAERARARSSDVKEPAG